MERKGIRKNIQEELDIMHYYFAEQDSTILTSNLQIYQRLSVICVIVVAIYVVADNILTQEWHIAPYRAILWAFLCMHIVVSAYINKHRLKSKALEKAMCVAFSLCVFLMLICADTIATPSTNQIFCSAFLVVAPCIFIMNGSRMLIDQVFFVVVYAWFAYRFKEPSVAARDMPAIWAGFFFGIVLYIIIMDLRLQINAEVIRLKYFSETDELTKIKNRREANAQISYLLNQREKDNPCAMIMLDVDFFKTINDTYGHKVGDQVLVEVAKVLSAAFRKNDIVSRFGGDEFMIFVTGFDREDFPEYKCRDIQDKVRNIMQDKLHVSCSMGICVLLSGHRTLDELVCEADKALYQTKERERGGYTVSVIQG